MYAIRKQFFNDSAEKWIDMWYRHPETGEENKHKADFRRLCALIPFAPGDCVLDAGCGTGVLVPYILDAIGERGILYELDYAEKMIAINQRLHPDHRIRFIVSDIETASIDEASCDVALCFSCFPHFQDKPRSLRTISRVLKSQGVFVVAHFDSSDDINAHHKTCHAVMHDHLPDETTMRKMMEEAGLVIEAFIDEKGFYYLQARKKPC
jgi:demethylmenaquinone methyltransferase/2-methoxy-6-polyprenyl-1,4-benzoquinol methylase